MKTGRQVLNDIARYLLCRSRIGLGQRHLATLDWARAYDGDSFYFSWESARTVNDIVRDPQVALSFQGSAGLLGKPPLFIAVEGTARIVRDRAAFADHWSSDLERWFPQGIDTEGMVMIHVHADRIHYWDSDDEGEISM